MIQIPRDFQEFLQLLNDQGIEYLIVGGYAVGHYGYVRYTGDLDIFVALSKENAEKLVRAFRDFGFNMAEVKPELFLNKGRIVRIGNEPMRLEILNEIDGVDFEDCYAQRNEIHIGGLKANVISLGPVNTN
jgi:predicted nucleotidyltransferase